MIDCSTYYVCHATVSLELLPGEPPRLFSGGLVVDASGPAQNGPVEGESSRALEKLPHNVSRQTLANRTATKRAPPLVAHRTQEEVE